MRAPHWSLNQLHWRTSLCLVFRKTYTLIYLSSLFVIFYFLSLQPSSQTVYPVIFVLALSEQHVSYEHWHYVMSGARKKSIIHGHLLYNIYPYFLNSVMVERLIQHMGL